MDEAKEIIKQKNSRLSILLIIANLLLMLIFVGIGQVSEDQSIINIVWLAGGAVVLLGGYAFSYHGKGYRLGKWLFAIALLIALALFGLLIYATGLGQAFAH